MMLQRTGATTQDGCGDAAASRRWGDPRFLIGVSMMIGAALVLVGWYWDVEALKRGVPGAVSMKPNTALLFLLLGASLLLPRRGSRALAALGAAGATITLLQYPLDVDLGLDQLVPLAHRQDAVDTSHPGRMAPATAAALLLLNSALLLRPRAQRLGWLLAGAATLAALALVGHLYGVELLYQLPAATAMALPTALLLLLAVPGCAAAIQPRRVQRYGLLLVEPRRAAALLAVTLLPLAAGWLALLGYRGGWYAAPYAVALCTVAAALLLAVLTWRFIGRLERVQESLRQQERSAVEARLRKDELVATLSHDLRSPLGTILNWTALLGMDQRPETVRDAVSAIERSVRTQTRLVEDLVEAERLDARSEELPDESVDVVLLARELVDAYRPRLRAARTGVTVEAADTPLLVRGDPLQLERVLRNLLENAARHAGEGGSVTVRVERHVSAADPQVVLQVVDDGDGVAPEDLPHLFDRYWGARERRGIGLGLYIVKRLVERHAGSVTVESEGLGHGTCFTVRIPLRAAPR